MSKKKRPPKAEAADPHVLYEASVQSVESNLFFMDQVFRELHGKPPRTFREDFCGTARMACEWATWDPKNSSWGVDTDPKVLAWGREQHLAPLPLSTRRRIRLVQGDVLEAVTPPVELIGAFNFSYFIFKERAALRRYFQRARDHLKKGGLLVLDLFGGINAATTCREKRTLKGRRDHAGNKIPRFTYLWEQAAFNVITNEMLCRIHFRFPDGSRLRNAFVYDWRLWTIPELRELLAEAGFHESRVYGHGWTRKGQCDNHFTQTEQFENEPAWLAYIIGVR